MGIERFFSAIEENDVTNTANQFSATLKHKLTATDFFMDFNSVIYVTSYKVLDDLNKILYSEITNTSSDKINALRTQYDVQPGVYLTHDQVSQRVLEGVRTYVLNAITNYIDPDKLQLFYIAIDGVPSKAKMLEQKRRRYMGAFSAEITSRIFDQYSSTLDKVRLEYEQRKYTWKTYNITPGTTFMYELNKMLSSKQFEQQLYSVCKNLKTYIFSGPFTPGEGENKIVNYLRTTDQHAADYLIYSPDSDVMLLALLLNCKVQNKHLKTMTVLRQNQQKKRYDVIYIDQLHKNIYSYVVKNTGYTPTADEVIKDVVFLLSIFGNDFIPKISTYTVSEDFSNLIDMYAEVIKSMKMPLISYDTRHRLSLPVLIALFKRLKENEGGNLQKAYASNNYQNYYQIKNTIGDTPALVSFLEKLREFNNDVRELTVDMVISKYSKLPFINTLKRITRLDSRENQPERFINAYYEYYQRQKKFPEVGVVYKRWPKTLKDSYQRSKLERSLDNIDSKLAITKYDEQLWKFEHMLDEYRELLNTEPVNLGYVAVDPVSYTFKTDPIVKSIDNFYKKYFHVGLNDPKLKQITQEYIDGLIWVFEYYYNDQNPEYHLETADTWVYNWSKAPLLTQIYDVLVSYNESDFQSIWSRLATFKIPRAEHFTTIEQMMYVTPGVILKQIAPKVCLPLLNNQEYFPDIDKLVDQLETGGVIDCNGVTFINKCHLKVLDLVVDDKKFISMMRSAGCK